MDTINRLKANISIAVRRLLSQAGLSLAATFGLMILFALIMSIPSYADAVSYRMLSSDLSEGTPGSTIRMPFVFKFLYFGSQRGAAQWENLKTANDYFSNQASIDLGLPQQKMGRYFRSFPFQLYNNEDISKADKQNPLTWVYFVALSDLENHISVVEGTFPSQAAPTPDGFIEVLLSEKRATQMGISAGETFMVYNKSGGRVVTLPVRITGIWRPATPKDYSWYIKPDEIETDFLIPENAFLNGLTALTEDEAGKWEWRLELDSSSIHAEDTPALLERIARLDLVASGFHQGVFMTDSPQDLLITYQQTTNLVSFLLTAFSVPIAVLFLAYINLVNGVIVDRQRNEIAVLRSRGATVQQIIGLTVLEGVLLIGIALACAAPLSMGLIHLMGKTRSFLDFSLPSSLRLDITNLALVFGVLAALLVLAMRVGLVVSAARHTIITYKQEQARSLRPPWWQRAGLDIFLFIPAVYGAYLLRQQGSILPDGLVATNDPFQNPLLMLVPALGIFAIALFLLRLLPRVMAAIAWAASRTPSMGLLLASRHLARSPGFYASPLILLILTLSLSAFTASLAQTLDQHFYAQQYYKHGADIALVEQGQCLKFDPVGNCDTGASSEDSATWSFLPVAEHLTALGVQAATRVGVWTARTRAGGKPQKGAFFGIDRLDFPSVGFWRDDFATESLGELMNALASDPAGVLISRDFMNKEVLYLGDPLTLNVEVAGQSILAQFTIVGSFDMFPTWYPETGPLFVGNLNNFFEQVQGQRPYQVWLKTEAEMACAPLVDWLENPKMLGLDVSGCFSSFLGILQEQQRPEHQGLFGLLSVGFAGAGLLTVLGFFLYTLFSFQRRLIEMGVLRALGLSAGHMRSFLAWELLFLIGIGTLVGTALGVFVSRLFIPYLQLGSQAVELLPPFVVQIAWGRIFQIYFLFALLFVAAFIGLSVMMARMKIFQAVKLGETL